MPREDALSGDFQDDLEAVVADPRTADLFADGVADRFLHLQEAEARQLLDAEYARPKEARKRRSEIRGEAIHCAFARLCAEAGRERRTPLLQVAASRGERAQLDRQLDGLVASSHRSTASTDDADSSASTRRWRRVLPRIRRRNPATWDWAGHRSDSTYDHLRLYHAPSIHILLPNLIL